MTIFDFGMHVRDRINGADLSYFELRMPEDTLNNLRMYYLLLLSLSLFRYTVFAFYMIRLGTSMVFEISIKVVL